MAFKQGIKQKNTARWYKYDQILEVLQESIYLGVKLETLTQWRRKNESLKVIGKQTLRGTDKCLMIVCNTNVEVLNVIRSSNIACASGITGEILRRFCKKVIRSPRITANGAAK